MLVSRYSHTRHWNPYLTRMVEKYLPYAEFHEQWYFQFQTYAAFSFSAIHWPLFHRSLSFYPLHNCKFEECTTMTVNKGKHFWPYRLIRGHIIYWYILFKHDLNKSSTQPRLTLQGFEAMTSRSRTVHFISLRPHGHPLPAYTLLYL